MRKENTSLNSPAGKLSLDVPRILNSKEFSSSTEKTPLIPTDHSLFVAPVLLESLTPLLSGVTALPVPAPISTSATCAYTSEETFTLFSALALTAKKPIKQATEIENKIRADAGHLTTEMMGDDEPPLENED